MEFSKYQSLGNDYLVYDCNRNREKLSSSDIARICDRHLGIGADGILVGPHFTDEGISLDIFNADGGEAEQSGNGILIFAKYLKDAGYIQKKEFALVTKSGINNIRYHNELGTSASVVMGKPDFTLNEQPEKELVDIPLDLGDFTYRCTCVSIGNPHCVLPYRVVTENIVCDIGRKIENSAYFVNQINTEIAQIIDRHNIKIEIYERGSGYTLASGSSACAAVAALRKMGYVDNKVHVEMPGGRVLVSIDDDWTVSMTGVISIIGSFRLSEEFILSLIQP
jgi:diaminopimelate epimerase